MFAATRYFTARFFAPRYWPKVGADAAPAAAQETDSYPDIRIKIPFEQLARDEEAIAIALLSE